MNPSDLTSRLIPLSTGQPGLRSLMHIQVREPSKNEVGALSTASPSCVLEFISSDESLDRYNEIISAAGWKLDNYRRNPVFQNAHQTGDILHTLGRAIITEVRTVPPSTLNSAGQTGSVPSTALFQRIEFACDVNPMARIAYGLYKGQFLNAVSVGFVPIRWKDGNVAAGILPAVEGGILPPGSDAPTHSRAQNARRIFLEQELLEVSAVAIPANPNALALGLKSGAVEKSDLKEVVELFRSALADGPQSPGPRDLGSRTSAPGRSNTQTEIRTQIHQLLKELQTLLRS